jgi:iron complex outermembrane receptor protein
LLGFSALLQNTISGTVTDSSNNPIIGVSIYVPELHKGTATDLRDAIPNLPVGNLKLLFEYVGYSNQVKTLRLSQIRTI